MALSNALIQARRQTATAENRARQHRAELRLEEIVKVSGIADSYMDIDREGDLNIETQFARLYQSATDDLMRSLIVQTFVAWQRDEAAEEAIVRGEVGESVQMLKTHNPTFIDGAAVPAGSDVAA